MARNRNMDWNNGDLATLPDAKVSEDQANRAVLQDIRDELQALNNTLRCSRVAGMADAMIRAEKRLAKAIPLQPPRKPRRKKRVA
jgi:hypothetical protein